MVNFEDEDPGDDFEVEFSDLPAEEMRSISGKLVTEGAHLWARGSSISSMLVLEGFRWLSMARRWLLSEIPEGTFADGSTKDDIELEITDLSPVRFNSVSNMLTALGSRLSPRVRLWRLVIVGCTVLLALLLILGGFPSARDWLNGLLLHLMPPSASSLGGSKPIPYTASSIQIKPGAIMVVPPGQGQATGREQTPPLLSREGTVVFWDTDATPGLAPQGQDCPARPAIDASHEVGNSPVWVGGFEGPYATLYLYPSPVPVAAFPQSFGWAASILLEVPANSTRPITLDGADIYNDSTLLFQIDSSQEPTAYITLDPQQATDMQSKSETEQRISWSVTMYFSAAGCYMLNTAWTGGQWHVNFAAGR